MTNSGCKSIDAIQAKLMGQLQGRRICGAPAEFTFSDAVRPINMRGECPQGTLACDPTADADNIVCLPETDPDQSQKSLGERCPIVDMEIASKADFPNWLDQSDSEAWTSVELSETLLLRYTKKGNRLPLTRFNIGYELPCIDMHQQVIRGGVQELERQTDSYCDSQVIQGIRQYFDVGYKAL